MVEVKVLVTREASGTGSGFGNDDKTEHHWPQENKGRSRGILRMVGMLNDISSQYLYPVP